MLTPMAGTLQSATLGTHKEQLNGSLARPIVESIMLINLWAQGKPIPITNRTTVVIARALRRITYRV